MNKFEKQLEKWNNGVLRGAQAKLAKELGVSTATTALWTTGKRHPSKGYVAQMAKLFALDTYSVLKLFEKQPTVIYPDPISIQTTYMLRERGDDTSYTAHSVSQHLSEENDSVSQSNTLQIPFVQVLLPSIPYYSEDDIIEWWRIPRRYAQGAKYLVSSQYLGLEDADSPDDLCLVKPCSTYSHQAIIVFTNGKGKFTVRKVLCNEQPIQYMSASTNKPTPIQKQFYPIGQIMKRIKPL